MSFRLVPNSVTLNDLERRNRVVDTVMDKTTIMVTARPIKSSIVGT